MKKLFTILVIFFSLMQIATAQPKPQDTSDIIWSKYIWPLSCSYAYFSPDGNYIYAAMGGGIYSGGKIAKLAAQTGDTVSTFEGTAAAYVMDYAGGKYIATITGTEEVDIWDVHKEKLIKSMQYGNPSIGYPKGITISPDDRFVLIGLASDSGQNIVVYDPNIDKEIIRFRCQGTPLAIKFTHDGTKFSLCSYYADPITKVIYNSVTLWETGTWKQIAELYNKAGSSLDGFTIKFSFNDLLLGFIRPGWSVFVIDINSKQIIKTSDLTRSCGNIDFLPDNIHWFFYYASSIDGSYSYEYYNSKNDVIERKYQIRDGGADCYKNTNELIVNGYYWLTLFKPAITGIENPSLKNEKLNITEQPGNLTLEITTEHYGNAELTVTDLLGKNIYQQSLGFITQNLNRFVINVNLPVGIYLCMVQINDYTITQKFQVGR